MDTNLMICQNEVFIEGESVGQFESFELQSDAFTFGDSAVLTIPLYAIGVGQSGPAKSRIRSVFKNTRIRPTAKVEVYVWYKGQPRLRVFLGWIEHVGEGFPTKLYLRDNTFILRFGSITKAWDGSATVQSIIKDCIPIAQEAFKQERQKQGFTGEVPQLTYSTNKTNVQAITTSLSFRNWGGRSPYDTLQKLMQLLVLYGGVSDEYNVYIGTGRRDNTRPIESFSTKYNVFSRDIVPVDSRFVNYDVKVTGILSNGKQYTATGGYRTSASKSSKSEFDKTYGEPVRTFCPLQTVDGIQKFADQMLEKLRGFRNRGTIVAPLYPKVQVLDQIHYTDTIFPELGQERLYYIMRYRLACGVNGYFQHLTVTDQQYLI